LSLFKTNALVEGVGGAERGVEMFQQVELVGVGRSGSGQAVVVGTEQVEARDEV